MIGTVRGLATAGVALLVCGLGSVASAAPAHPARSGAPAKAAGHFVDPWEIADGLHRNTVWISSRGSVNAPAHWVDLYNYKEKKIVKQVPVGSRPAGITTSAHRHILWTANYGGSTVTVVNAAKYKKIATIHVGGSASSVTRPEDVEVAANGEHAFVVCEDGVLTEINTKTYKVVRQIHLSDLPAGGFAITKDSHTAYVGVGAGPGELNGSVDVVNLVKGKVSKAVPVTGGDPTALTLSHSGKRLYLGTDQYVFALTTSSLHTVASYQLDSAYIPENIAMFHDGSGVWVALDGEHDQLAGFTAGTLQYAGGVMFPDFSGLHDVYLADDGKYVIVTLTLSNKVRVLKG